MRDFEETLFDCVGQKFRIDKMYFERKTEHQHLMIFHNAVLGRVMTLDGIVQTTEADEFVYHEMLTHVPLIAHGNAQRVLIVGGGDGGMLREVVKHPVEQVVQVEIDAEVIDMARRYLPAHSNGAFDDPRCEVVIDDGFDFMTAGDDRFDVIIVDSTDPIGPGEVLFSDAFYAQAKRRLATDGILVTQNGVPFFQPDEVPNSQRRLNRYFHEVTFYCAAVPTYYGGVMAFGWATDQHAARAISLEELTARFESLDLATRYYTPEVHRASFALPQYVIDQISTA